MGGLPGDDDIRQVERDGAPYGIGPTQVGVALATPSWITWWKEIRAFDGSGHTLNVVRTLDDAHGPVAMIIDTRTAAALVFTKAGFLNFPKPMYDLRNLSAKAGKLVTFTWNRDG